MQNTMINNKEREALQKIYSGVDEFIKAHNETSIEASIEAMMELTHTASKAEKIHTLLYMDLVKDFIQSIGAIRGLLEESEEEFVKTITDDGKMTLDEVERKLMTNMLMDVLFSK